MKIHALCTDIDGTLLDSHRSLSPRTIAAIKRIKNKLPVILASSRMPSAIRHLQYELGLLDHPMICYNGGYVIHYPPNASLPYIFDSVPIDSTICKAIINKTRETSIHVSLYQEDYWYAPALDQWTERESRITKVNPHAVIPLETVIEKFEETKTGAHKVMCMGIKEEIQSLAISLNAQFHQQIYVYPSKSTYLEIAPRSVSKATALEMVLKKHYSIDLSGVMAFGDNYNDIELLQKAGWGVAVGNARDEVKAIANEITLNNVDDGVAVMIEKYCF